MIQDFDFSKKDTRERELLVLYGRVEAVAAYLSKEPYPNKGVIAAMLGITLRKEVKNDETKDNSANGNSELD